MNRDSHHGRGIKKSEDSEAKDDSEGRCSLSYYLE